MTHYMTDIMTCNKQIRARRRTCGQMLHTLMMIALMIVVGGGDVWGQTTDYSGIYYIRSHGQNADANNIYYLCPTEGWCFYKPTDDFSGDGTTYPNPFLTTYKCKTNGYHSGDSKTAIWTIEKAPNSNYYHIKQTSTGKYLLSNGQIRTAGIDRIRVHLETVAAPSTLGDEALFEISPYSKNNAYLTFRTVGINETGTHDNADHSLHKYLTVNGGNKNNLTGQSGKGGGPNDNSIGNYTNTSGIVGIYTEEDVNAPFSLEQATIDPPTITNNFDGTITITTEAGADIYYTTDETTPTTSDYTGTGTTSVSFTLASGVTVIKAIAKATSDYFPTYVTTYNLPVCERPTIKVSGGTVTITCSLADAAIYYTTNGDPATASSTPYNGPFAKGDATTIRAVATKVGYLISSEAIFMPPTEVSSSGEMTDMNGNYLLTSSFTSSGSIGTSTNPFKGTIDGNFNPLTLSYPLVAYADGAIIKNVILDNDNVTISDNENGNAGAICCEATGDTRIYNCGVLDGSVEGSNNVGGIVGLLDGRSRVINCYNYANITSGSNCGGIVGYNNVASTSGNLQTMVMSCMFYGNITGGNAAPIYGGEIIHNKYASADDTGLNNYCYFLYDETKAPYLTSIATSNYHGALGAEERYLNRFELFRMTLNSTRNLAAYYVTGDATQKEEMAKWVLDKSIAPYPILKVQGKYPSVVNPDAAHATTQTERNKGGKLGTLSVSISGTGSGAVFSAPTGASLTTGSLTLNITDKDYDNFNYNYRKVQLPYYNDVGTGNYTKASDGTGRVVTGWKITLITGGTPGSFTTNTYDYPSFNFVDRKCTNKDLYSVSSRVFAQGAYWEVPDDVTAITIEPYWAKAVYLSDANYDATYSGATKYGVTVGGDCPKTCNEQQVYNTVSDAMNALSSNASHTVYDYAVVLVGNYHQYANTAIVNDGKPVTFMSADLDGDNEPDNTLFYYHNQRQSVSPIRFDFLNIPGIGMVKRTHDATMDPEPGIFAPKGWFEITNTVFIRFGQFEYAGSNTFYKTTLAPLILQGGIYEQFVSCCRTNAQNTNYLLIGGNAWFKNFANGCHTTQANTTPKVPINVTGGDYTNFYLTGIYQPAADEASGNAECYIDGGRFSEVAGSGMQQVKGNVTWLINAADITKFFGGGINAAKPLTGSISTTISNSYVDEFYGGPKFGDMVEEKTVTTNATDCHFGKFFGAGYGGTAFNRVGYVDDSKQQDTKDWDGYVSSYYKRAYSADNSGISTNYEYEFILHSDGNQTVARFFVNYASLSLASTRDVTSTLSGCTIGTFYGGGSLGAVNGDVNSTLTNCTVTGNAYGAGFSASVPTVEVWNAGANLVPNPTYNRTANVFNNASVKTPKDNNQYVVYTWSKTHGTNASPFVTEDGKHYIHTDVSLENLGTVIGNATLNITGTTTVNGDIYGGGEESNVNGNTTIVMNDGTVHGSVYGGGKGKADTFECEKAMVGEDGKGVKADFTDDPTYLNGNTHVTIGNGTVMGNVYGGGEVGRVEKNTEVTIGFASGSSAPVINGDVFGGGKGVKTHGYAALVRGNPTVTVQADAKVLGSVYGGGEIASVARYKVAATDEEGAAHGVSKDMPYALANSTSGNCIVTVTGNAEIGPDGMKMYHSDKSAAADAPDDKGHVFGAGKGFLPEIYSYTDDAHKPKRMIKGNTWEYFADEDAYIAFIQTQALSSKTKVTIGDDGDGNPFIKGSVYGGSENGLVQFNTEVYIKGGQIGCGKNTTSRHPDAVWSDSYTPTDGTDLECASWEYKAPYAPYDPYANATVDVDKYPKVDSQPEAKSTEGGRKIASDGHTYYGNVFGGGSGCIPYFDTKEGISKYLHSAGTVKGDTYVEISGGHILTNVYGGCEATNVLGSVKVKMTGGSLGVPRTVKQILAHPVTCYLFGAGKGDQRIFFNKDTNVNDTDVEVDGGRIYGSVFGGGEDGHVLQNTAVTIKQTSKATKIGTWGTTYVDGNVFGGGRGFGGDALTAGNVGGSVDVKIQGGTILGSIYGGGRLASVGYGLYMSTGTEAVKYGVMRADDEYDGSYDNPSTDPASTYFNKGRGHIEITISGGTIGNDHEYIVASGNGLDSGKDINSEEGWSDADWEKWKENHHIPLTSYSTLPWSSDKNRIMHTIGGNVFAGGMGRLTKLDGTPLSEDIWPKMGRAKSTKVTVSGGIIKSNVYGGGELGVVEGKQKGASDNICSEVNITGGIIGTEVIGSETIEGINIAYTFGGVYGGGYGSDSDMTGTYKDNTGESSTVKAMDHAGNVYGDSKVTVSSTSDDKAKATRIRASVYGGAELAFVTGDSHVNIDGGYIGVDTVYTTTNPGYVRYGNYRMGNVYGGGSGRRGYVKAGLIKGNTNVKVTRGHIFHNVYGGGALASVGDFDLANATQATTYGVAEGTPVEWKPNTGTATVEITGGVVGITGRDNGMVNGSSRGDVAAPTGTPALDVHDLLGWVKNTVVTIGTIDDDTDGPQIKGSLYGGGENGHNAGDAEVTLNSGTIGIIDKNDDWYDFEDDAINNKATRARGNVFGSGCGTDTYEIDKNGNGKIDDDEEFHNPLAGIIKGNTVVTINGGRVGQCVYGGGSMGSVDGNSSVTITGGRIGTNGNDNGNVCGGPKGISDADITAYTAGTSTVTVSYSTTPTADNNTNTENLIAGSVFGGGEAGIVKGSVTVALNKGLVLQDVYGGGALADTNTGNVADYDTGGTTASSTTTNTTTVNLLGGYIKGDAYGGGLGQKTGFNGATSNIAAVVYGDIAVTLNGTAFDITYDNAGTVQDPVDVVKSGRVFGCNNLNGSPQGDVTVTVWKTVSLDASGDVKEKPTRGTNAYELAAVYGGGNLAPFTETGKKTNVIIHGCDDTSIETVYGGGNAAAVPETDVDVYGDYEIGSVFGGGNGKDKYKTDAGWQTNPGADVNGNTNTMLYGGIVHEAYGASNRKGTIHGSVTIDVSGTNPKETCPLNVAKIVGAGKNADVDGDLIIIMGCKPETKIPLVYGGADDANVDGDVELTITSGNFGQVFGGNNLGGAIRGHIKLNIEETGNCKTPITIEELYLGGNQAAYSKYGYYVETNLTQNNGSGTSDPDTETAVLTGGQLTFKPRTSASDTRKAVKTYDRDTNKWTVYTGATGDVAPTYTDPELNVISCTSIGKVFGGGLGTTAKMYADPTVNINMIPGSKAALIDRDGNGTADGDATLLGAIGDVFGGGNAADIEGTTTVNIGTATSVNMNTAPTHLGDEGTAYTYNSTTGKYVTTVHGAYITGSVYGGGSQADVLGNTNVTMSKGYVFNGIFGGGYAGSVGTFDRRDKTLTTDTDFNHSTHECIGKPTHCVDGTGKCTVVVNGGQIGPIEVATEGMTRIKDGKYDPVSQGWVWGGGCGLIEDPAVDHDTHFKTYVGSTDVTIGGTAFILESIIGGGEFGRVLGDTKVTIEGHCQIGVGAGQYNKDGEGNPTTPKRYAEDDFINPATATAEEIEAAAAKLPECSHLPYGRNINEGTEEDPEWVYEPYDPYYDTYTAYVTANKDFGPASTSHPSDGKTWIGCVFGGGSGYMPYLIKENNTNVGYDWCRSAGLVEGNSEVNITGGHILTNVYGGNEITEVKGKATVKMSGGTIGVPRTLAQIAAHPLSCYLFGAGKGDERSHFFNYTNVNEVEVEVSGGIIYGSVFGGSEDGNVLGNVNVTVRKGDSFTIGSTEYTDGPVIGTWGTSYVEGNVFGGGRGFSGSRLTAGNVDGNVTMNISGGTMLGSIYGGGRLGSIGTFLAPATDTDHYGKLIPDGKKQVIDSNAGTVTTADDSGAKHGHVTVNITGGTIGNTREFKDYTFNVDIEGKSAGEINAARDAALQAKKDAAYIPNTEFNLDSIQTGNTRTYHARVSHTKGGNVFAGGMGRLYKLDGTSYIDDVDWWKLGCVKSTTLTIKGGTIRGNVYGGGELGQVVGYHTTKNAANEDINASTEVTIKGSTTIGTEVSDGSSVQYTFGSVFAGGYGSLVDHITVNGVTSQPKFIAGLVKEDTKLDMQNGEVKASIYGGGEMASVEGSTDVTVSNGTIGKKPITVDDKMRYFGAAKMGNVYGGGSGHYNTVRSGLIKKNSNVTISGGTIYHNVYGGGAFGTVGEFNYTEDPNENNKVIGVNSLKTEGTGVARVTITGGTIGYDGKNNGMVFGSSRGDINKPGKRDDHAAWVYNTHVTIGTANGSGPHIMGSLYGSGENGHVFNDAVVTVNGGTIGIYDSNDDGYTVTSGDNTYSGAAYPNRGNVYGAGCGTDKYYSGAIPDGHTSNDGEGDSFNPLAGIVYGNTTVNIKGGTVVRNVYGAGAMGSVGRTVTTTGESGTTTTYTGGLATVNINGGTIGHSGTVGDGNVFGAARGDLKATGDYISQVRKTNVNVSSGQVKGNVYGGGELGDVGTIDKSDQTNYNYNWKDKDGSDNAHSNNTITGTNNNTGICTVTVTGGTIGTDATTANADGSFDNGNVYGGGKGSGSTWWCEKAIAYATDVTITGGTVHGSVYGGGEVGRVEDDAKVTIGTPDDSGADSTPTISGSVFGAGKGLKTHGYSALVRGNANVTVQGKSVVSGNVFGGGEIASVGRFFVDKGLPKKPLNGGTCTVLIQDEAKIGTSGTGHNVFGACKGVNPAYDVANYKNFKSMQIYDNRPKDEGGTEKAEHEYWDYYETYPVGYAGDKFVWVYYKTEDDYLAFLKTLALTSNTHVTIDEDADIYGSVFGGGERGVTLGSVDVNIVNGTIHEDVYGGGSLADSNSAMRDAEDGYVALSNLIPGTSATGYYSSKSPDALITDADATVQSGLPYYAIYKTNVNLHGGKIGGTVFGGALGQVYKAAEAAVYFTQTEIDNAQEGDPAYNKTTSDIKTPAQPEQKAIAPYVYGDVLVKLNENNGCADEANPSQTKPDTDNCQVLKIHGCNNNNGTPKGKVKVHVYKTVAYDDDHKKPTTVENEQTVYSKENTTYDMDAVYGGGNMAAYEPTDNDNGKTEVIIDGCDKTSIKTVYGGGNAAPVPATEVTVNGTFEIGTLFAGGNGKDNLPNGDPNPGANVGYHTYPDGTDLAGREAYAYGSGVAYAYLKGGTIYSAFGGSNTKGNVRTSSTVNLNEEPGNHCPLAIDEVYGAGNNADQDGKATIIMGCISYLKELYGGAKNADIDNDVVLNVVSGRFERVFGGNNLGGCISGSITVNVEETGCHPIIIGQLYGGGNQAGYSVYGYKEVSGVMKPRESATDGDAVAGTPYADPVMNVKSFTSIGEIFGGGFGEPAVMVGNPHVYIDECVGDNASVETETKDGKTVSINTGKTITICKGTKDQVSLEQPLHEAGKIGAIGNVYGGGNAAKIIGNTNVLVGTRIGTSLPLISKPILDGSGNPVLDEHGNPTYEMVTPTGIDIRGNVFGGGNNAEVTGNTNVQIGRKVE